MLLKYLKPFLIWKIRDIKGRLTGPEGMGSTKAVCYTEGFVISRFVITKFTCIGQYAYTSCMIANLFNDVCNAALSHKLNCCCAGFRYQAIRSTAITRGGHCVYCGERSCHHAGVDERFCFR